MPADCLYAYLTAYICMPVACLYIYIYIYSYHTLIHTVNTCLTHIHMRIHIYAPLLHTYHAYLHTIQYAWTHASYTYIQITLTQTYPTYILIHTYHTTYTYTHIYTYIHMHTHIHTYTHTHAYVRTHTPTTHTCIFTNNACIHSYHTVIHTANTCITHIHVYTHTPHTYIHVLTVCVVVYSRFDQYKLIYLCDPVISSFIITYL